ncbi:hypothetical protein [Marinobacterium lutimaris]|uniref:Uncharacterized protein n=1 Tax=Marinobacterium lutimaris TaxID=568106 RepID=A0A1H5YC13_9GAMM|nr:hypothetical protein [Marinobacterium lutimaris]SEG21583.1 hypothetical protein SAMN05444390_1011700 [Marinobacterium lutimaris]
MNTILDGHVGDEQEHVGGNCSETPKGSLAVGTRVTSLERNRTGVIEGLCEYKPGCYLVKPEAPTETEVAYQSRWICAFDQVEIVSEVAA